ncbi:hypothetical protein PCANB_002664 [Pneumocystis canis]|nr:hypothetical protein PCANB_002664 [Pneumocystis canis]
MGKSSIDFVSFRGFQQEIIQKTYGITHIIDTIASSDTIDMSKYTVLCLNILDEQENIIQYFPKSIQFIENCFDANPLSKILIFCQAGISRSTTIAAAYLMKTLRISKEDAIAFIKKVHPKAQPNRGFMEQLQLFEDCHYAPNQEMKQYRQWLLKHQTSVSLDNKTIPTVSLYPQNESLEDGNIHFRCKKCRFLLANSNYVIHHEPSLNKTHQLFTHFSQCTHLFLEPLIWMKKELDNGNIEGKFNCPKCNSRIGKYAWQGMTCSCRKWITPALSIQKGKIDMNS